MGTPKMEPIMPPACNEPDGCSRKAAFRIIDGRGESKGDFCGGHATKHFRAAIKESGAKHQQAEG